MYTIILDVDDPELETLNWKPRWTTSSLSWRPLASTLKGSLTRLMYQESQCLPKMSWFSINRSHQHSCPDLLALVDLILSFPASTAERERGFNTVKQAKTIGSPTLAQIHCQICLRSCCPFQRSGRVIPQKLWWHQDPVRSRRPDFMDRAKKSVIAAEESDEEV